MNILYMNQGGGGNWGAIKYSSYDLLLLAEGGVLKKGFEEFYNSATQPAMQIQVVEDAGRFLAAQKDLDITVAEVRPLIAFQLTRQNVYVIFVHLKSGHEGFATKALEVAVSAVKKNLKENTPILWIGDFNRADTTSLQEFHGFQVLASGGGQAKWDLDKAIITGVWKREVSAEVVSKSGDNGHIAIAVTIADE